MRGRAWVLLAAACFWLLGGVGLVWADEGRIAGSVQNGTTGQPAAGLTVVLHVFSGMTEQEPMTAVTGPEGAFEFAVPLDEGSAYWLTTTHEGVPYATDLLRPPLDQPEITVTLQVYDATPDPSAIQIERGHLIVDFGPGELRVAELYVMSNLGQRTFVGDESARTLQFLLPDGAMGVQVGESAPGDRFVVDGGAVWDTAPLLPGRSVAQHVVTYRLPYDPGEELELVREYAYPVAQLNLLVPQVGVDVTCDDLQFAGTIGSELVFLNWRGESLAQGDTWSVHFRGEPSGGADEPAAPIPGPAGRVPLWVGMGIALLAVLTPLVYLALRRRRAPSAVGQDRLLDDIARLDAAYEAGELDEAAYRREREERKAELIQLLRQAPGQE